MCQIEQRRIAYDACEWDTYQVSMKGPKPKDAYILLGTFRTLDEAKLIYDYFPLIAGNTLKITDGNNKQVRGYNKTFRRIETNHTPNSALDLCDQSDDLWETIVKGYIHKTDINHINSIIKPIKIDNDYQDVLDKDWKEPDDSLVRIANKETKRQKLAKILKDAAQPFLTVISGGK